MKWSRLGVAVPIFLIRLYQRFLSPWLSRRGVRCRFHPTCSQYAILALEKHGLRKGSRMAFQRLRRCNPYNTESCIDYP